MHCGCYGNLKVSIDLQWDLFVCLCWGLTSQSTIFQSCRDGATASWVINQYFRAVKCLAQGHNTAAVGFEPPTSRSGVRHSTTEPPRSPTYNGKSENWDLLLSHHTVVCPKDAEGMAKGVDPDQSAWNEIIGNEKGFDWNPSPPPFTRYYIFWIFYTSHNTIKCVFGSFRPGQTQTGLRSHRSLLESWNFGYRF